MNYNSLQDYPKLENDLSDSERIQRAIDDNCDDVLFIPKGIYEIASPLFINNRCSLLIHPCAKLKAVKPMEYVLSYDGNDNFIALSIFNKDGSIYDNLNISISGGDIDGNGLASCLSLRNAHHFTLKDISLHNGLKFGLNVGGDYKGRLYELVATNVYCKCTMSGLKGNVGIYTFECDGHYTDCFIIDYTKGFVLDGAANRLTRCHIWGGTVPPVGLSFKEWSVLYAENKKALLEGTFSNEKEKDLLKLGLPEMLGDSIGFEVNAGLNVIDGCFADTASIGFKVKGDNVFISNSGFFNNKLMGLRNAVAVESSSPSLTITNSFFVNATGTDIIFKGNKEGLKWVNNSVDESVLNSTYFVNKNSGSQQ